MKHNLKITIILLVMFLITQFIGLAVIYADVFHRVTDTGEKVSNPQLSWVQHPELETNKDFFSIFPSLIIAFIVAIILLFFLSKFKVEFFLRSWFFVVVALALWICIYAFEILVPFLIHPKVAIIIPTIISIPLAYIKIYKKNFLVHNITELFIYPGIAAIFVPMVNIWTIIILLIIISIYDMWAVWHSGIMQKMARYQIDNLNIFSGFFVPYVSKKVKLKLQKMRKELPKEELKTKKVKVNVAILGGGDIVFPIITAGVLMITPNLGIKYALFAIFGALLGLSYLFFYAEKKKFYPAMPFITLGIFIGMLLAFLF